MRIALSQRNYVVGDLAGNAQKILDAARAAESGGAALLVTSELAISGYPPEDLILRPGFNRDCYHALTELARALPGITAVVGHPHQVGAVRYNAASVLQDGSIVATYHKAKLPNDSVFDEQRYFQSGHVPCIAKVGAVKIGVVICQDVWEAGPAQAARAAGADLLVVLNGSPYHLNKQATRYQIVNDVAREIRIPVLYCNQVGGQDELVFDGASFAVNARGELTHQLEEFEEGLALLDFADGDLLPGRIVPQQPVEGSVYRALCMGVRDYVGKNGFPGVLLGLSGGIDSALTLAVAADALGCDKVHAVMMPSQFTAGMSMEDAQAMVDTLGVRSSVLPIKPAFDAFLHTLADEFNNLPFDTTEENIQARIRGTLLMALSNKYGSIVLTTGNKSEMAVGYCTLYGDMAGGFAVLRDISKTMVYRLARYRNTLGAVIPERVITRAPSAELRPNQTDQDSLPPYDILDGIVALYMEQNQTPDEIVAKGYTASDVARVVKLITVNEYKRRQAPVGVRITERGFGKDWRYPITSKYRP